MAIEYICDRCGSTNVTSDTISRWDTNRQCWVIVGHYDSSECLDDCEGETNLVVREVAEAKT